MKSMFIRGLLTILCIYTNLQAVTRYVPQDYPTIAAALAAGSDIEVDGGTYTDPLNFNNKGSVTIRAVGDSATIIQWDGINTVALTAWQGSEAMVAYTTYAPIVHTIIGIDFKGISSTDDTISQIIYGGFNLSHCTFTGAVKTLAYITSAISSSAISIDSCHFSTAGYGLQTGGSNTSVQGCVFHNINSGTDWSGPVGLFISSSNGLYQDNIFYNCGDSPRSGIIGSAIWCRNSTKNTVKNNLLYENGYGIQFYSSGAPVADTFENNTVVKNSHDGAKINGNGNCIFENNIFSYNGSVDTLQYFDMKSVYSNKPGSEICYNLVGRYNDSLSSTFNDSLALGNLQGIPPQFEDTSVNNYELATGSPCIDQGDPDTIYNDADGSRNDMGAFGGKYPLPVELTSFQVQLQDGHALLLWTTATEHNNLGFNVLKSTAIAGPFIRINPTLIQGHMTTANPMQYSYTDEASFNGNVYYQLEQIDINGAIELSQIIQADFNTSGLKDINNTDLKIGEMIKYYDIYGRQFKNNSNGLYIKYDGQNVTKILRTE